MLVAPQKEEKICCVQEPYKEDKKRKNWKTPSDLVLFSLTIVGHLTEASVGKARAEGGDPILDWGSRECEGRWWWLMARTWIQAPWRH